jgi:hypothetical protein
MRWLHFVSRSLARTTFVCLSIEACAPAQPLPDTRPAGGASGPTTIFREASYEDADLAARGRGRLEVVVRASDRPTQALPEAQILIRITTRDTLRRVTDQQGLARFDSVPVGNHEMLVRRIGYGVARAEVPIKPGCRTDVETYIAMSMIGIAPPPPMPGRVTITTCR